MVDPKIAGLLGLIGGVLLGELKREIRWRRRRRAAEQIAAAEKTETMADDKEAQANLDDVGD